VTRNPETTRQRIFEAAVDEFARHGIAGARIDRIAEHACANKQLIYAYFGSKQALFDEVITDQVSRFHEEVHLDPYDIPAFAGAAFDFFTDNPAIVRLGSWHSLEPGEDGKRIEAIERSLEERVRSIRKARTGGHIDTTFAPEELLVMVYALARAWIATIPEFELGEAGERASRQRRRRAVVEATRRLVAPLSPASPTAEPAAPRSRRTPPS
jgi:AcrR family transcriptional regulator